MAAQSQQLFAATVHSMPGVWSVLQASQTAPLFTTLKLMHSNGVALRYNENFTAQRSVAYRDYSLQGGEAESLCVSCTSLQGLKTQGVLGIGPEHPPPWNKKWGPHSPLAPHKSPFQPPAPIWVFLPLLRNPGEMLGTDP